MNARTVANLTLIVWLVLSACAHSRDRRRGARAPAPAPGAASRPASQPAEQATEQAGAGNQQPATMPANVDPMRKLAPGERMAVRLPGNVQSGILLPDGTFLPPLNGITNAPPLRLTDDQQLTPVVAKVCDADGVEWWEHANGAMTTTRLVPVVGYAAAMQATTVHVSPRR